MRKTITAVVGSVVAALMTLIAAPLAHAFVPPEPIDGPAAPAVAVDSGISMLSWQVAVVAVIAVAVGAVVALTVERIAGRSHGVAVAAA